MANAPPPYSQATGMPDQSKGGYPPFPQQQPYPQPYPQPQPYGQPYAAAPAQGQPMGQAYPQPQTVVVTQPTVTVVRAGGNCPYCGVGVLTEGFSVCGILLAIFCFPIGIICCLLMTNKRCTHCGHGF